MAILAALDEIDLKAAYGHQASWDEYKFEPPKLPDLVDTLDDIPAIKELADLLSGEEGKANLSLVDQIDTLINEAREALQSAVEDYRSEYQSEPIATQELVDLDMPAPQGASKDESVINNEDLTQSNSVVDEVTSSVRVEVDSDEGTIELPDSGLPVVRLEEDGVDFQQGEILEQLSQGINSRATEFVDITDQLKGDLNA